jgi:hypothetical protein
MRVFLMDATAKSQAGTEEATVQRGPLEEKLMLLRKDFPDYARTCRLLGPSVGFLDEGAWNEHWVEGERYGTQQT